MVEQCLTFTEKFLKNCFNYLLMKTKKRVKINQRQRIVHQYCDNNLNKGIQG